MFDDVLDYVGLVDDGEVESPIVVDPALPPILSIVIFLGSK
jgi:hypothetical protein